MHIIADRDKLLARVRRIAGQVNAVERQLAGDAGCSETLQLVASVRGAAIAGGFMVANMCDLIIAADDAFFADPRRGDGRRGDDEAIDAGL